MSLNMASSSAQPSDYECPICHENFSTPKILPCAHLLCRQCVVTWLKSDAAGTCPICRDVIADAPARAGKSFDDIADALPTDLAMEARVECAAIVSKSHECGCCRNASATDICLSCGEILCANCTQFHANMLATRRHKVEDLASITAETLASGRQIACSVHSEEMSQLFCPNHSAAICILCATSVHRSCPEVCDLEKRMEEARGVLAELAATLKAGEDRLEGAISQLDAYLSHMEKATKATLTDIDLKFDEMKKSMDACHRNVREQAQAPYTEAKKKVEEEKSALLKRRGKAMSYWRLVDRVGDKLPRACGISDLPYKLKTAICSLDLDGTSPADMTIITSAMIDERRLGIIESELSQLGFSQVWIFHSKHGSNIALSNDRQTAERITGKTDAVVLSNSAMTSYRLYEVRLDAVDGDTSNLFLKCGVTHGDPVTLALPSGNPAGWTAAVVIDSGGVWRYGPKTDSKAGRVLGGLQVESRVGVMVDADDNLHLYVDGQDQGVAVSQVRRPCHAFFYIHNGYKKISVLPSRTILER